MDEPQQRGRRRIDRASDPSLSARVRGLDVEELRSLRDDCRTEEQGLSYARRLLQGRIDIARAEVERRAGRGGGEGSLVAALPGILADDPSGKPREPRNVGFYSPAEEAGRRFAESLVEDSSIAQIPDMDDEAVDDLLRRLQAAERTTSELRAAVLGNLDALQAELVRRYRDGEVAVDDVVQAAAQRVGGAEGL